MTHVVVENVNDALAELKWHYLNNQQAWREIAPRGLPTKEWKGVFVTEYQKPWQRVVFNPFRDANPFFHFFEALWILAGRRDVAFLSQFTGNISQFSDNGLNFHGAYGKRLRHHFSVPAEPHGASYVDQLREAIEILKRDPDGRQVVLSIWDPESDLGIKTKDTPCNTTLYLKIRDDKLNLTVCCRSNDAILGAYGANAVQFSTIQEFIASALGIPIGTYTQVSDSFHIYEKSEPWRRMLTDNADQYGAWNLYKRQGLTGYSLLNSDDYIGWLDQCEQFCDGLLDLYRVNTDRFFRVVAKPMLSAHNEYRKQNGTKNERIERAIIELRVCAAADWKYAANDWLLRRRER